MTKIKQETLCCQKQIMLQQYVASDMLYVFSYFYTGTAIPDMSTCCGARKKKYQKKFRIFKALVILKGS